MKKRLLIAPSMLITVLLLAALFQVVAAQPYTLDKNIVGSGDFSITPDKETYDAGETVELAATAAAGWEFSGWSDTSGQLDGETTSPISYEVNQSATITATFTEVIICYELSANETPTGSGSFSISSNMTDPSCGANEFPAGSVVTFEATASAGYEFSEWQGATPDPDTPTTATVVMSQNRQVTAVFDLRCQPLTLSHTGNGEDPAATPKSSPGCADGEYKKDTSINLQAYPDTGWQVASWEGTNDDASTLNSNTLTMPALQGNESEHSVLVNYEQKATLKLAQAQFQVREDAGQAVITVNRTGSLEGQVAVTYNTGAAGDSAVAGEDYVDVTGRLRIPDGAASGTFTVDIIDNNVADGSAELTIKLSNPSINAFLTDPREAQLIINDNEGDPTVQFEASNYEIGESDGQVSIAILLDPPPENDVFIDFLTSDGTATSGEDYTAVERVFRFRFAQGDTRKVVQIPILPDDLDEADETVLLSLANPVGADLGTVSSAELLIVDDDATPSLSLSNSEYFVKVGAASTSVPVILSTPSAQAVEVEYSFTLERTGTISTGALTFEPGDTTRNITIPLTGTQDGDVFAIQLSEAMNATLAEPSNANLYILDTDINDCNALTFTFTGQGQAPIPASKDSSLGCPNGQYVAGETINIIAQPAPGWFVTQWAGTTDDESTALENSVLMPDEDASVNADYRAAIFLPVTSNAEFFFDGPNEAEPNNFFAEANGPLRFGQTYFGGFPNTADFDDRYFFLLENPADIVVTLDDMDVGQDYNLYVYDINFNFGEIGYSGELKNLQETISLTLEPGKYYVRVVRADGQPTSDTYALRLSASNIN